MDYFHGKTGNGLRVKWLHGKESDRVLNVLPRLGGEANRPARPAVAATPTPRGGEVALAKLRDPKNERADQCPPSPHNVFSSLDRVSPYDQEHSNAALLSGSLKRSPDMHLTRRMYATSQKLAHHILASAVHILAHLQSHQALMEFLWHLAHLQHLMALPILKMYGLFLQEALTWQSLRLPLHECSHP